MILLRDQLDIALGSILVFVGLSSIAIGLARRRGEARILLWFGIQTGIYGARLLLQMVSRQPGTSPSTSNGLDNATTVISYLFIVAASLFWLELSLGALRRFIRIVTVLGSLIAIAGILFALLGNLPDAAMPFNRALALLFTLVIMTIAAIPSLSRRFLVVPGTIPAVGMFTIALASMYVNGSPFFSLPRMDAIEPPAFAIFIFSLGYAAAQKIFADERRLLSIENELEIARGIQNSILPPDVPQLEQIGIAATYCPMTAVAGDYYDFLVIDRSHAGFLVADVSGHGVPAALIASMIKIAMQSVVDCAHDPGEVLRRLNRTLTGQMKNQFVTAAYLWLDTETRSARYSAAGHPPLLHWQAISSELQRVESNGLLMGMQRESDYPVREFALVAGDRLLLYTDGIVEAENDAGDAFGDSKLEQMLRTYRAQPAAELSEHLLTELRNWQPKASSQQDDITLVVIDVL